jgi:hypothetical protein
LQEAYICIFGPVQNGVGIHGRISITTFRVQAALAANPDFPIFQGDNKNGYNEKLRKSILVAMKKQPEPPQHTGLHTPNAEPQILYCHGEQYQHD